MYTPLILTTLHVQCQETLAPNQIQNSKEAKAFRGDNDQKRKQIRVKRTCMIWAYNEDVSGFSQMM